jgi:hypothetical protein
LLARVGVARYFLQIPAIFEQQLAFSTTLIFDEPSFRNGIQVSGFIDRPIRELVINLIGQKRRSWYTMTHHALLSTFTARKHGISDRDHFRKLVVLSDHVRYPDVFSDLERQVLRFVDMFVTDPKGWSDDDCAGLKRALFGRRWPTLRSTASGAAGIPILKRSESSSAALEPRHLNALPFVF